VRWRANRRPPLNWHYGCSDNASSRQSYGRAPPQQLVPFRLSMFVGKGVNHVVTDQGQGFDPSGSPNLWRIEMTGGGARPGIHNLIGEWAKVWFERRAALRFLCGKSRARTPSNSATRSSSSKPTKRQAPRHNITAALPLRTPGGILLRSHERLACEDHHHGRPEQRGELDRQGSLSGAVGQRN